MPSDPKDVFSLNYMKRIRFLLNIIACFPNQEFGGSTIMRRIASVYRCLLISFVLLSMTATISYHLQKYVNHDLAHSYVNMMLGSVFLQRLFLPFQKKFCLIVKRFASEFHLLHYKSHSENAAQIYDRVNRICAIVTSISMVHAAGLPLFYNGIPLYNNIKSGMFSEHKPLNDTYHHSVYFDLPFDQYRNFNGYLVIFFYNIYVSYNVTIGICIYDVLIFSIVFHIWGHINILVHDLTQFMERTSQLFEKTSDRLTQEDMFGRLKDIIRHHQKIKEFMACTEDAFSITLCCYLLFHQLSGCVLLLKCSYLDPIALGRYGLLTIMVFQQMIETSVIFELVNSKSHTLADHVYGLPWENMDLRNRRIVVTLLHNVQDSLALKAGGMVPVGVYTMSTIIRTSCSYFIMLRTLTDE